MRRANSDLPQFSWSKSRAEIFDKCRRLYYLDYYRSWGGWLPSAKPEVRETYRLKRVSNRYAWSGIAVHDHIARYLKRYRRQPESRLASDEALETLRQTMRQEFADSANNLAASGKKVLRLAEHENRLSVSADQWAANWQRVETALRNLEISDLWQRILASDPQRWKPVDTLDSFELDDVKIWAAPDFAGVIEPDGPLTLIDWKTGKPRDSDRMQLSGYALFALEKWGVPLADQRGIIAYLNEPSGVFYEEVTIDEAAVEYFKSTARGSIESMRQTLRNVATNQPKVEAQYPRTDDETQCKTCKYRRLCWKTPGTSLYLD